MNNVPIELVGAHEIRELLGNISRQRVYQLTQESTFPSPAAELAQGKVWLTEEVVDWIAQRQHRTRTRRRRPVHPVREERPD